MSCMNPIIAIRRPSLVEKGKFSIKIFGSSAPDLATDLTSRFGRDLLYLPCGKCEACKMDYRKDWAVRCEMESLCHEQSCFLTLTLDDKHYKDKPVKEDIQYFLHRLRSDYGIKCRYFACGEVGSHTNRSHYHMILFGYKPSDLRFYGTSKGSGEMLFTSKFMDMLWQKGRVLIGDFNFATASYVAGYVNKNKGQSFLMFSTRPGIGFFYMHENFRKLFRYGIYQGKNGKLYRLPRYFDKVCQKCGYDNVHIKLDNADMMEELNKSKKFIKGLLQNVQLFASEGQIMKDKLKKMKRSL